MVAFVSVRLSGLAQTIYSENFDSGFAGESLTDPQYGFTSYSGDLKLGSAKHGWTGNSIIGSSGSDAGQLNLDYKFLPLPAHGLLEFSEDFFSPTLTGSSTADDVAIQLFNGVPGATGNGYDLRAEGTYWFSEDLTPGGANYWYSPTGLHNEVVTGSIFWNQDTGEHWSEVSDGTTTFDSPHLFDPSAGPMTGIDLYIDQRDNTNPGDIDNLRVIRRDASTPEPFTMSLGIAGAGLFFRRRLRLVKGG
ncbi:MAG TPA: hypothetical protein VMI31_09355 [Fimbriimonadaceae bacterium]|nr:hypothetical protein [Fimbriimonadaceae bacterium]